MKKLATIIAIIIASAATAQSKKVVILSKDTSIAPVATGSGAIAIGAANTFAIYGAAGRTVEAATLGSGVQLLSGTVSADVAAIQNVTDISAYNGASKTLTVKDEKRGGIFNFYEGAELVDNGMIFLDFLERKWKRQIPNNKINIQWYGAVLSTGIGVNDIFAQFNAAKNYVADKKGLVIYLPSTGENTFGYYCSQTLSFVNINISIEGDNIGATGHNTYSTIHFPFNVMGFDLNCTIQGQYFATIKNIKLIGQGELGVAYDITKHGIQTNGGVHFENIFVDRFSGNGFDISGFAGTLGNSDRSQFINCAVRSCNNGFYISGYDANTMVLNNCAGDDNRRWGFYDNGFLGNLYLNCNTANNGNIAPLPAYVRASYNGINYLPISNDDFNNTNVRPDLNPLRWRVYDNGVLQPAWDSTKRYYSGGSFCSTDNNGAHVYVGNYQEDYQPGSRFGLRALVLGGQQNESVGGGFLTTYNNSLIARTDLTLTKNLKFGELTAAKGAINFVEGTAITKNINISADEIQQRPNINFYADGSTTVAAQQIGTKEVLKVFNNSYAANHRCLLVELVTNDPTSTLIEAKSANDIVFKLFANGKLNLLKYNSANSFTGTPVANLQVTSTGDVITEPVVPPEFVDNAAAIAGGLSVGRRYRTGDLLKVVH